jgi:Rod binding domain-containing protein
MNLSVLPDVAIEQSRARLERLDRPRKDPKAERQRLREAAKEFEVMLLETMVRAMRKNVPESGLFPKDSGREIFQEMLDTKYARLLADRGNFGLDTLMVRQLGGKVGPK